MKRYNVYGIGNALIDSDAHIKNTDVEHLAIEPGVMTLINATRHAELIRALDRSFIHHGCGGSAANTLIAIQQLGGQGYYSCKVADDASGHLFLNEMTKRKITCNQHEEALPEGTTGQCLVMVTEDAERTMNTYLGISESIGVDDLDIDALEVSQYLYLEGYLVASKTGLEAMRLAVSKARDAGVAIAITLSDPNISKHFRDELNQVLGQGIDLMFCNEDEALYYAQTDNVPDALKFLRTKARHVVMTLGSRGVVIAHDNAELHIPTHEVKAVDTVGAGDMFAGAYLYALCQGYTPLIAAALANRLAAEVVSQYGARLNDEQVTAIKKEFTETHFGLYPLETSAPRVEFAL
jgi:sugar/nucleoside kinase (ribokinase family)